MVVTQNIPKMLGKRENKQTKIIYKNQEMILEAILKVKTIQSISKLTWQFCDIYRRGQWYWMTQTFIEK